MKITFYKLVSIILLTANIFAANYYVATSGNDSNDGAELTPFKTLEKASEMLDDGDSVWLNRGDTFRGVLKAWKDETVTIGAYGSGEKPIIKGSVPITSWTLTTHPDLDPSKVYEADVSATAITNEGGGCLHLFVNEEIMTIARYPNVDFPTNENWLKIDSGGKKEFTDAALATYNSQNDYWQGATVRYRSYSWENKAGTVKSYNGSSGKINMEAAPDHLSFKSNWGYFIDNKLQELDYPGEWFYDFAAQKVYLYPKNGINPNNELVEGMTYNNGINITWHSHYGTVQDLDIRQFKSSGINLNSSSNPVVRSCLISHCKTGIGNYNSDVFLYQSNEIHYARSSGINVGGATETGTILNNQIINTAVLRIYAITEGITYGQALNIFGDNVLIKNNWIENTCYSAMEMLGNNHVIENNFIRNAQCVLNDGGSITVRTDDIVIKDNIILESYGDVGPSNGDAKEGSGSGHNSYGIGIFFMGAHPGAKIIGNTIASCRDRGILTDETENAIITNNTFFSNRIGILLKADSKNLVIKHNKFLTGQIHNRKRIHANLNWSSGSNISLDHNFYCNPYTGIIFTKGTPKYSLDFWKSEFPEHDQNSFGYPVFYDKYLVTSLYSDNLLTNSTFDSDVSGWGGVTFDNAKLEMDGGAAKVDFSAGSKNISQNVNPIDSDKWLHIQFDAIGDGFFHLYHFLSDPPNWGSENIDRDEHFFVDNTKRTFNLFVKTLRDIPGPKFYIGSRVHNGNYYWLDNFLLEEVAVDEKQRTQIIIESTNAHTATADCVLLVNPFSENKTFNLPSGAYNDLSGFPLETVSIKPYESKMAFKIQVGGSFNFLTKSLVNATIEEIYFAKLLASGGVPPYSFDLISGNLPTGLDMNATGIISGTPTVTGTFSFAVSATDFDAASITQQIFLTVITPPVYADAIIKKAVFNIGWSTQKNKKNKDVFVVKGSCLFDDNPIQTPLNISAALGSAYAVSGANADVKKNKKALAKNGKKGKVKIVWNKKKKTLKFLVKLNKTTLKSAIDISEDDQTGTTTPDFILEFGNTIMKAKPVFEFKKKGSKTKGIFKLKSPSL